MQSIVSYGMVSYSVLIATDVDIAIGIAIVYHYSYSHGCR